MSKKLCKLYKNLDNDDDREEYIKMVKNPKFLCTKCGRVSKKSDVLCKFIKIDLDKKEHKK